MEPRPLVETGFEARKQTNQSPEAMRAQAQESRPVGKKQAARRGESADVTSAGHNMNYPIFPGVLHVTESVTAGVGPRVAE